MPCPAGSASGLPPRRVEARAAAPPQRVRPGPRRPSRPRRRCDAGAQKRCRTSASEMAFGLTGTVCRNGLLDRRGTRQPNGLPSVTARAGAARRNRLARCRRCSSAGRWLAGWAGCRVPPRCRGRCPRLRCRRARRWRRSSPTSLARAGRRSRGRRTPGRHRRAGSAPARRPTARMRSPTSSHSPDRRSPPPRHRGGVRM